MSIGRMSAVWKYSRQTGSALLALLALADRADEDGFCWPGVYDIAQRARVEQRHAIRLINELVTYKELYVHRRPGQSNQYAVLVGMTAEEIYKVLSSRFKLSENDITKWLRGDDTNLSPVTCVTWGGDTQDTPGGDTVDMGGVTPETPKPSFKPKLKPKEKRQRGRDTRLDHPSLKAYRAITHLYVPYAWRDDMIAVVGDGYEQIEKWRAIVKSWVGKGWSPANVEGMLDSFKKGKFSSKKERAEQDPKKYVEGEFAEFIVGSDKYDSGE